MLASEVLEFDLIKETLSEISKMNINKERFLDMEMSTDRDTIELMLRQVDEASQILYRYGNLELVELGNIYDSVDYFKELDKNSVIAFFATTASDGKNYIVKIINGIIHLK